MCFSRVLLVIAISSLTVVFPGAARPLSAATNSNNPEFFNRNVSNESGKMEILISNLDTMPTLIGETDQYPLNNIVLHSAPFDSPRINTLKLTVIAIIVVLVFGAAGYVLKLLRNRRFERELSSIWMIDPTEVQDVKREGLALYKGTMVKKAIFHRKTRMFSRKARMELREMRQLTHPNVNNFLGLIVSGNSLTVITENCSKGSLHDILMNKDWKMDRMFAVSFVDDLVKGMIYIHSSALKSHGSLKSTNCLISARWRLQIADFGLRDVRDEAMDDGKRNVWTSLLWTAPEAMSISGPIVTPMPPTQKSDVFSFGVILNEIFTRRGPHNVYGQRQDDTEFEDLVEQTVRRVKSDPTFRPDTAGLEVDEFVKEVMVACWHQNPAQLPKFNGWIKNKLKKLFDEIHKQDIVDHMMSMMEKYQEHLEELVAERTAELRKEQKRSEHLLRRIFPKSVAKQLLAGERVTPKSFPPVTIYFSDIIGFTTISGESMSLEVVQFLDKLYILFDSIIRMYDVYKVETIGDAYMVASGVPQYKTMEHHAEQIAMMALHILSGVRSFRIPHRPNEQIMIRIGMHTGPCAAGVVGSLMPRYTLFGDTVNTASRMESNGVALRIHCSSSTRDVLASIDSGFLLEKRGELPIKGKGKMTTYFLNGRDGHEFPEGIEEMEAEYIFPRQRRREITTLGNRSPSHGDSPNIATNTLVSTATRQLPHRTLDSSIGLTSSTDGIVFEENDEYEVAVRYARRGSRQLENRGLTPSTSTTAEEEQTLVPSGSRPVDKKFPQFN